MLDINVMKANAIVATLLLVAAVHADARFASPYPRKAVAPDESGGWIAINGNAAPAARSPIRIDELSPRKRGGDSSRKECFILRHHLSLVDWHSGRLETAPALLR